MNFYNPLINVPENSKVRGNADYEEIAEFHWNEARKALAQIHEDKPALAEQLTDFMTHCLLAVNAYNHDIFQRRNPTDEDFETRIRKNR